VFYEEVFDKLNRSHINYVVVGGVALVLHGVVRLTADLDLMVHLENHNLKQFIDVMKGLGYRPKIPVKAESFIDPNMRMKWIKEKNMKVFSFFHPHQAISLIDVFVNEPISYHKVKADHVMIRSGNINIPIVSKRNLIKLKNISGRPQDIADIAALKEVMQREKE
tara:strand:+ start:1922 stop:2416 length:495 start_codon:yes stop_codon:yes gene_type:complete